jgi:hypothetical protein
VRWSVVTSGETLGNKTVQFRRGALVVGRQPQQSLLADLQFIDVLRVDLGLDRKVIGLRNDHHDGVAGGDHPADGMNGGLQDHAVLRGAGIEYAFLGNWSVKAEYNHLDFAKRTETLAPTPGCGCLAFQYDIRQKIDLVKVSLNYKFDWATPVVAKY